MARLRIFAGPNGSGKSALEKEISHQYQLGHFINADSIFQDLKENKSFDFNRFGIQDLSLLEDMIQRKEALLGHTSIDFSQLSIHKSVLEVPEGAMPDEYFAGALATFVFKELALQGQTFSYETVMSDERKIQQFREVKERGFRLYLYFICTDAPEINIGRIHQRVANNGHHVPDEVVIKRYYKIFNHLLDAIKLTNRAYLFDNSGERLRLFMEIEEGLTFTTKGNLPRWFIEHLYPKLNI